jgi:hypothetical protein
MTGEGLEPSTNGLTFHQGRAHVNESSSDSSGQNPLFSQGTHAIMTRPFETPQDVARLGTARTLLGAGASAPASALDDALAAFGTLCARLSESDRAKFLEAIRSGVGIGHTEHTSDS